MGWCLFVKFVLFITLLNGRRLVPVLSVAIWSSYFSLRHFLGDALYERVHFKQSLASAEDLVFVNLLWFGF